MANRIFNKVLALDKQLVTLFGNFVVGASGAVGATKGLGIKSVVKETTAGQYTITLDDAYDRYMFGGWGIIKNTSFSDVYAVEVIQDPATFQATFKSAKTIVIQCYDAAKAAVNPVSGTVLGFSIVARRSTVGIS